MKKVALFASGSGSNVQNISEYFATNPHVKINLILSNNPNAFVLERAKKLGIQTHVFTRDSFYNTHEIIKVLEKAQTDFIVLAGFLWLIPQYLIQAYPNKIINIHPALLPKYGGKGMYGSKVHEAVINNKEKESGITIHYVNEQYDEGSIIFQALCMVKPDDSPESVAKRIHELEYEYYPKIIEQLIMQLEK